MQNILALIPSRDTIFPFIYLFLHQLLPLLLLCFKDYQAWKPKGHCWEPGSAALYDQVCYTQASVLCKQFHRSMKASLQATFTDSNWIDRLPWVLSGLQSQKRICSSLQQRIQDASRATVPGRHLHFCSCSISLSSPVVHPEGPGLSRQCVCPPPCSPFFILAFLRWAVEVAWGWIEVFYGGYRGK